MRCMHYLTSQEQTQVMAGSNTAMPWFFALHWPKQILSFSFSQPKLIFVRSDNRPRDVRLKYIKFSPYVFFSTRPVVNWFYEIYFDAYPWNKHAQKKYTESRNPNADTEAMTAMWKVQHSYSPLLCASLHYITPSHCSSATQLLCVTLPNSTLLLHAPQC